MKEPRTCQCGSPITTKSARRCDPCQVVFRAEAADRRRAKDREIKRKVRGQPKQSQLSNVDDCNFVRDEDGSPIRKRCTACLEWKDIGQFNKRKDTPSGVVCRCKECEREIRNQKRKEKRLKGSCEITPRKCVQCMSVEIIRGSIPIESHYTCNACHKKNLRKMWLADGIVCRRCGERKLWQEFSADGEIPKCKPSACNECKAISKMRNKKKSAKRKNRCGKHRARRSIGKRLRELIGRKRAGWDGSPITNKMIKCSSAHLFRHIESQFTKGMSWDNYGTYWHIDHIVPCAAFDHTDDEQVRKCWHFSNLRPLEASENIAKSDSIVDCQPELILSL